jgi:predicted regulator of Ras-like GTPase activity (Roadblock/LC7/MglB family)
MRAVTKEAANGATPAPATATAGRPAASHPGMVSFADPRVVAALLTDRDGMVVAEHAQPGVSEVARQTLGAVLAGLAGETNQVLAALGMGPWRSLRVECTSGALGLAPASDGHVVILAVQSGMPLGLARRYLVAAQRHARSVLEDA